MSSKMSKDVTISHNHVDIRPTNVSFINLSPKCKVVGPSQFCASVPTSKNSKSTPVSQPTVKPNKANVSKSQSRPVTRSHIVKTCSGCKVKPPVKLNL